LSERPEQWKRLREDRALIPTTVEEMLRWTTPVISFMRTATVDTRLDDVDIAAGDPVLMLYAAANRDPATFGDDAEEFRVVAEGRRVAVGRGVEHQHGITGRDVDVVEAGVDRRGAHEGDDRGGPPQHLLHRGRDEGAVLAQSLPLLRTLRQ